MSLFTNKLICRLTDENVFTDCISQVPAAASVLLRVTPVSALHTPESDSNSLMIVVEEVQGRTPGNNIF